MFTLYVFGVVLENAERDPVAISYWLTSNPCFPDVPTHLIYNTLTLSSSNFGNTYMEQMLVY